MLFGGGIPLSLISVQRKGNLTVIQAHLTECDGWEQEQTQQYRQHLVLESAWHIVTSSFTDPAYRHRAIA